MRVKLRPGCHFAPTEQGLSCGFHGSSFVMRGPSGVFRLLDAHIGELTDGADLDRLVAGEQPAAQAVLRRVVGHLLDRGMVLDLDTAGGPPPDPATAARHEDVLSHLEEHCARPYQVFAELLAARVAVRGTGHAADALVRTLESYGIGIADGTRPPDLTVAIDDTSFDLSERSPWDDVPGAPDATAGSAPGAADAAGSAESADGSAPAASGGADPAGSPRHPVALRAVTGEGPAAVLPVFCGPERTVVGPVLAPGGPTGALAAAVDRIARWHRADPTAPAPLPVAAVLAGSLAARRVLDRLAGIAPGDGDLLVVHGPAVSVTAVPFTPVPSAPGPLPLPVGASTGDPLGSPDGPTGEPDGGPGAATATSSSSPSPSPDSADAPVATAAEGAEVLTAPWRGLARWAGESAGSDRPVVAAVLQPVAECTESPVLGWGDSRAAARRDALLGLLRARVRSATAPADDEPGHPWAAAAGSTPARCALDGVLRLLAAEALLDAPPHELTWPYLGSSTARAMWSTLTDYHGVPVSLTYRQITGLDWPLVGVHDARTGGPLAVEWGPSLPTAAHAALGRVLATVQRYGDASGPYGAEPGGPAAGTWCVELLSDRGLSRVRAQLSDGTALRDRAVSGQLLASDPVFGPHPLPCGRVRLT